MRDSLTGLPKDCDRSDGWILQLQEHVACGNLRIRQGVLDGTKLPARDVVGFQALNQLVYAHRVKDGLKRSPQLVTVRQPISVRSKPWIVAKVLTAQGIAELNPEVGIADGDND